MQAVQVKSENNWESVLKAWFHIKGDWREIIKTWCLILFPNTQLTSMQNVLKLKNPGFGRIQLKFILDLFHFF